MSTATLVFLGGVVSMFVAFMVALGGAAIWSGRGPKK